MTVETILFFPTYYYYFFHVMNEEPCKNRAREMIHVICQKFDCGIVSLAESTLSLSRHVLKCLQTNKPLLHIHTQLFIFQKNIVCLEATYQYKA